MVQFARLHQRNRLPRLFNGLVGVMVSKGPLAARKSAASRATKLHWSVLQRFRRVWQKQPTREALRARWLHPAQESR